MSEFEDRLRSLELRQPLPEWHREISDQCAFNEPSSKWRGWLWPSPLAWAALAVIWFGLAVANRIENSQAAAPPISLAPSVQMLALNSEDIESFWPLTAAVRQ